MLTCKNLIAFIKIFNLDLEKTNIEASEDEIYLVDLTHGNGKYERDLVYAIDPVMKKYMIFTYLDHPFLVNEVTKVVLYEGTITNLMKGDIKDEDR